MRTTARATFFVWPRPRQTAACLLGRRAPRGHGVPNQRRFRLPYSAAGDGADAKAEPPPSTSYETLSVRGAGRRIGDRHMDLRGLFAQRVEAEQSVDRAEAVLGFSLPELSDERYAAPWVYTPHIERAATPPRSGGGGLLHEAGAACGGS